MTESNVYNVATGNEPQPENEPQPKPKLLIGKIPAKTSLKLSFSILKKNWLKCLLVPTLIYAFIFVCFSLCIGGISGIGFVVDAGSEFNVPLIIFLIVCAPIGLVYSIKLCLNYFRMLAAMVFEDDHKMRIRLLFKFRANDKLFWVLVLSVIAGYAVSSMTGILFLPLLHLPSELQLFFVVVVSIVSTCALYSVPMYSIPISLRYPRLPITEILTNNFTVIYKNLTLSAAVFIIFIAGLPLVISGIYILLTTFSSWLIHSSLFSFAELPHQVAIAKQEAILHRVNIALIVVASIGAVYSVIYFLIWTFTAVMLGTSAPQAPASPETINVQPLEPAT
ncbi:hypothetical protein [Brackiella oedipodis]|uniref:hypothetical protein n=1 Tax=Brackiella oedipodis TaxID=124225 RepID=UPI000490A2CB|nr:hypothetical protein [Brackiella oedipodis]